MKQFCLLVLSQIGYGQTGLQSLQCFQQEKEKEKEKEKNKEKEKDKKKAEERDIIKEKVFSMSGEIETVK